MRKEIHTITRRRQHRTRGALLCALALVCLSMPSVAFGKSLTGTFLGKGTGRNISFNHHGKPLSDWAGTLKFKLDSGEQLLVFCIQIDVRVSAGDRYRSDGAVLALPNGCKIRYLLDMYPASTAKDADEAAARQMAIWVFSDGVDPTTIKDAKVRDRTIALVKEANGKPCPKRRTEAPDLTIEPITASAAAGQVVAYSVHASSVDSGHPMTISISGPAVFSDATGANARQQQQTIKLDGQSAAIFWVLSTGAGQANVSVALPYRLEAGTVYSQIDDSSPTQRLVMAESLALVAKVSAQLFGAAGAPAPPTPSEQATAPTAPPPTNAPPRATHRPSKPAATEQPAEAVVVGEQATAAPSQTPSENLTAIPEATPEAIAAAATAPPAGGAAPPQPRSLPNTGGQASSAWLAIAIAGLLLRIGWVVRRRGTDRIAR
jgi:LPXTG-motif cell wall-anchored protein